MVVLDLSRERLEDGRQLQALSRNPDDVGQPRCGIGVAFDPQIAIADHVHQHHRLQRGERSRAPGHLDIVAAPIGVIVADPVDDRFFSVQKHHLHRQRVSSCLQHARELDEKRRARSAVVRADEAELTESFRVVVSRDDEAIFRGSGNCRDQVDHVHRADRCLIVPGLLGHAHARRGEPGFDVRARLFDRRSPCRPRTERHELTQVLPRAVGIKRGRRGSLKQES